MAVLTPAEVAVHTGHETIKPFLWAEIQQQEEILMLKVLLCVQSLAMQQKMYVDHKYGAFFFCCQLFQPIISDI